MSQTTETQQLDLRHIDDQADDRNFGSIDFPEHLDILVIVVQGRRIWMNSDGVIVDWGYWG